MLESCSKITAKGRTSPLHGCILSKYCDLKDALWTDDVATFECP